jgi:hypothetical protein
VTPLLHCRVSPVGTAGLPLQSPREAGQLTDDQHRVWSPLANAIGVQVAAIATHRRNGGMLGQPGRDSGRRAIRQQVDDAMRHEIDQDGAIPVAPPPGPLVHPDGPQG